MVRAEAGVGGGVRGQLQVCLAMMVQCNSEAAAAFA